jgi:hypothetical protein
MVASLGIGASAAASTSPAARPAMPVLGPMTLTGAVQPFRSTTHKHLRIALTATNRPAAGTQVGPNALTIAVSRRHAPERHSWVFELKAADFSYDDDTGVGALKTGSAIKPFGALALALTAVGRVTSVGCGRTRTNVQPVRVTGTLAFHTRSKGKSRWGSVGGTHHLTFGGRSIIRIADPADKLCPSFLPPCVTTKSWLAHKTTEGTAIGNDEVILQELATTIGSSTTYTVSGERIRHLAKPTKAVRTDTTTVKVPHTRFRFPSSSARVTVSRSRPAVTGSADLASLTMIRSDALACGTFPQTSTTTQWTASYRNAAHHLRMHEQIEGTYTLPNDVTSAEITRIVPNG